MDKTIKITKEEFKEYEDLKKFKEDLKNYTITPKTKSSFTFVKITYS